MKARKIIALLLTIGCVAAYSAIPGVPTSAYVGRAYSMGGEFYKASDGWDWEDVKRSAYYFTQYGKTSYYTYEPTYSYMSNVNRMNSDILYYSAHGCPYYLSYPTAGLTVNRGTSNGTNTIGLSSLSFSNTQLIIFDACSTAASTGDGTSNMCQKALSRGAQCVLGWYEDITTDSLQWLTNFYYYLKTHTIAQSITYADSFTYTDTALKKHRVYGSSSISFTSSAGSSGAVSAQAQTADAADERIRTITPIEQTQENLNLALLSAKIREKNPAFDVNAYTVVVSGTNEAGTDYVVDFLYTVNGCRTSAGYTFQFFNNRCTAFFDNYSTAVSSSTAAACQAENIGIVSSARMEHILDIAGEEIPQGCEIVKQEGERIYDLQTGKAYYRVNTTYREIGSQAHAVHTYTCEL